MASELEKAVAEKQQQLDEEIRLRQELAEITEKVAQDMEVHAHFSPSLLSPILSSHATYTLRFGRARIRRERCDGRERRPRSPPREHRRQEPAWMLTAPSRRGLRCCITTQQQDMDSKEEKIKELRVQIAMANDGKLHDQVAVYQTTIKQLQKQLAKEKELRIKAQVRVHLLLCDEL